MIEAIPITMDSIVLIITKVEDPDELDTRFSKFAAGTDETAPSQTEGPSVTGADDILDLFQKLCEGRRSLLLPLKKIKPDRFSRTEKQRFSRILQKLTVIQRQWINIALDPSGSDPYLHIFQSGHRYPGGSCFKRMVYRHKHTL